MTTAAADRGAPDRVYVDEVPDLIEPDEYGDHPEGDLVRLRISVTETGVEVLGDALRPATLEAVLRAVAPGPVEQMLCG
ncbi:radical SAM-modified peptide, FtsH ternary system-associated [Amycolatopsis sp. NPDC048633]|uniref:radical SAM-modified peptide, FtsH ternary system-associated n=1 Tax=Amycolatopsis sp. NPDC048633 TaxID=3157095 RepID=UPI0033C09B46